MGAHVHHRLLTIAAGLLLPATSEGQLCHGLPAKSIAFEYGRLAVGTSQGALATLGGLELAARLRDISSTYSGHEGSLRYSVRIGSSRVQFCPSVGATYQRDTWDVSVGSSFTINALTLRGGGGIGFMQPVFRGVAVNPFVGVHYQFKATHFDAEGTPDENFEVSGDTLSEVEIEYGMMAHYRSFYGGVVAHRFAKYKGLAPYMARWIVGFSFSGSRRPASSASRHRTDSHSTAFRSRAGSGSRRSS